MDGRWVEGCHLGKAVRIQELVTIPKKKINLVILYFLYIMYKETRFNNQMQNKNLFQSGFWLHIGLGWNG